MQKIFTLAACLWFFTLVNLPGATAFIGFARATADFRLDGAAVGSGTVFEGDVVETGTSRCVIQLAEAQITLGPESRARVYGDRTVLERGAGLVTGCGRHVTEAGTLRIGGCARDAAVQVEIGDLGNVTAGARGGSVEVRNPAGRLVASLGSGVTLGFTTESVAPDGVKMTGVVEARNGTAFLTDVTTQVTVQVQDGVKYSGQKVEITGVSMAGTHSGGGAAELVRAVSVKPAIADGGITAMIGGVAVSRVAAHTMAAGIFRSTAGLGAP